ncbi:MAG: polysaccharide biosynthesis tyrosine autokinase [Elusimicrobiaceae bacterium]|nr:polysaccharide biosynthesis tyrosine autokinase [Elusimicrobiaceae bacterium]
MNQENKEELDLSEIIGIVLKRFWLIVGLVLCGLIAAVLVNVFMRPVYEATALIMINKEDAGKLDVSHYGSFMSEEDYYRTQYQLLESRSLLERVYKQLDLGEYEQFENPGGVRKLKAALKISPITRSRLVNISVRSYDPQLAAEIANAIANNFVEENISNRISMGQDVIRALESSENSPEEQELLNSMPQVVNSDFIKSLKQQASALERQWAQLSAKYTPLHPEVISVKKQLAAVNTQIAVETRRLVQSIKIELSGQFSGNNIRVVDPAIVPGRPVLPRKLLNLIIGAFAGGLLGLLIVFALEFLDQSVKSSEDLEEKLGLAFLGFVPYEKNKKREIEYSSLLKEGNSLQAENIRNIRTMLGFALSDVPNAPFLITSSMQGEGKSHLSSNLVVALAQAGKKVLLVDGDLRRSRLHKVFRLGVDKGLSNIWSSDPQKADYQTNVQAVADIPNLFVMTSGQRPPNPAELLSTPKLGDFINWAQQNFDHLVIDCPAILPVSDTMLWGKYVPRAVFAIRYGKTNAKLARIALDKLDKAGIKVLGAVISQYRPEALSYGRYGYYKSYHYYDSRDEKKKK